MSLGTRTASRTGHAPVRAAIEMSWKRSALNGVDISGRDLANGQDVAYNVESSLLRAARPVLRSVADRLTGTNYSLILADPEGRVVDRYFDESALGRALDGLGIRLGLSGAEDVLGTNAIGTVIETRSGISVCGDEHFIEPFKAFTCYGHPIFHPVTRRLAGVLDISGSAHDANPLLGPFLARAVDDIETRFLDHSKASDRNLLAAFQRAAGRGRAVVALGGDVVLTNRSAVDLLSPGDYATIRLLADGLAMTREKVSQVVLASGATAQVAMTHIAGTADGILYAFTPATTTSGVVAPARRPRTSLVHGAPGTGRSWVAQTIAPDAVVLDGRDVAIEGEGTWARRLRVALADDQQVCVDGIDLLSDALITQLIDAVTSGRHLVLTSGSIDTLEGVHAALAAMIVDPIALKPLRERAAEIDALALSLARGIEPRARIRLVPSVIEALASRSWPGNFHELRAVMAHVVNRRHVGDVTLPDLPVAYQTVVPTRNLAGRERAERDAIVESLQRHGGNKVRAAQDLGISRTTLYARMRALRVVA